MLFQYLNNRKTFIPLLHSVPWILLSVGVLTDARECLRVLFRMKHLLNESTTNVLRFIKFSLAFVVVLVVYETFFGAYTPRLHGNLKGKVVYRLPKKAVPREQAVNIHRKAHTRDEHIQHGKISREVNLTQTGSDTDTIGPGNVGAEGSTADPVHILQLISSVNAVGTEPAISITNQKSHKSFVEFDISDQTSGSHSLMRFAELSLAGSSFEAADGLKHLFHEIKLTVSDPHPVVSTENKVVSDCNMYVSMTNPRPSSYEDIDLNTNQPLQALWDWKSNEAGPDTLTLHTYRPEFISTLVSVAAGGKSEPQTLVNRLFIGIEKRFASNSYLTQATGTAAVSTDRLHCLLQVDTVLVKREELSKKLDLRDDGRVVMPRDIARI